ncbi:MAG: ferritin family protein [Planctomycetes bacterium]|nr:ferritin family protein [Planctomycetota bacterium]
MELFDFAIQMEMDGEAYYRQLAHRTANTGLRTILTMLADEEVKHQQLFEQLKDSKGALQTSQVVTRTKNIFAQMKESGEVISDETSHIELYQKAQDLEKQAQEFYTEKSKEADSDHVRDTLIMLAKEEQVHYFILENIINFLASPQVWLEDAEFVNLDEY